MLSVTIGESQQRGNREHIAYRKSVRWAARKQFPGRHLGWRGGILYFLDTQDPVPNTVHIPKPGKKSIGLLGAEPGLKKKINAPNEIRQKKKKGFFRFRCRKKVQ